MYFKLFQAFRDNDGLIYAGYDEDAALQAALERSRQEAQQSHAFSQRQSASTLQDDETLARALQESLNTDHQDGALAASGNVRPLQVCKPHVAGKSMQ